MLNDLFSHKIHASNLEAWQLNLVCLATIFYDFHNKPFYRDDFDAALTRLAPQAARSPFRDQYSIYLSILGVGKIVWKSNEWVCQISNTARYFLIGTEPNVEAFCRLQLALYQRPDARGQKFNAYGLDLEHRSSRLTLGLIKEGYRLCPFRLILKLFEAKAALLQKTEDEIFITPDEIYAMANLPAVYKKPTPDGAAMLDGLKALELGVVPRPMIGRKTFKFLESTGLLICNGKDELRLVPCVSVEQREIRDNQIRAIRDLELFYDDFSKASAKKDLISIVQGGGWGQYFDALNVMPATTINAISGPDLVIRGGSIPDLSPLDLPVPVLEARDTEAHAMAPAPRRSVAGALRKQAKVARVLADPEATRIKRERRNAYHDLILRIVRERIEKYRLTPKQTSYIDIFTSVAEPGKTFEGKFKIEGSYLDGENLPYFPGPLEKGLSFIFEIKSSDEDILIDQIRKAVSQLYEYRFRYRNKILKKHVVLIIVLQTSLSHKPWLREYLLSDRRIAVCWVKEDKKVYCPKECFSILGPFVDGVE